MDAPIKDGPWGPQPEPDPPLPVEDLKPKKDCPICHGKGFVSILDLMKAACTCRYK